MRVFLTGGTGLIGRELVRRLLERGDQPVVLSRRSNEVRREPAMRPVPIIPGDPSVRGDWASAVDGCDAVVNLAGHNLFAERWSPEVKRKVRDSRVYSTEHVVSAIAKAHKPPKVLVQASAIGYYGPTGDEELNEDSPPGSDFMSVVCREWEDAASAVERLGVRLAKVRTGVVLAKGEGALGAMAPIYRWLPGGAAPVGSSGPLKPGLGRQWMSWIHVDDIVGIFLLSLDNAAVSGSVNGTAPNPVRHIDFGKALAKVLWRRLVFLPFGPPNIVLDVLLGEVAQLVTKGQKVLPVKAQAFGYDFLFPDVLPALRAVFAKAPSVPKSAPSPVAAHHH